MTSGWFAAGAVLAGAGVALGAFGAHGLKSKVTADLLAVFEIGVRYQIYHALALLAVSWATTRWPGGEKGTFHILFRSIFRPVGDGENRNKMWNVPPFSNTR